MALRVDFRNHVNSYGMLVQDDGTNSGNDLDSPQRMGMFWLGASIRAKMGRPVEMVWGLCNPIDCLKQLHDGEGNYRRSPNPTSRGYYYDVMTRDQQTGIIAMMIAGKLKGMLKQLFWRNMRRGWFTNNSTGWRVNRGLEPEKVGKDWPDFAGFANMAMCFRGMGWWWMYPLIMILDLDNLWGAVQYRFFSKTHEPLNHYVTCAAAWYKYPTPVSWLANRINDGADAFQRIVRYMDRKPHQAPPLYIVWDEQMMKEIM